MPNYPYTTLVEPAILADHLNDPSWIVVDCRFDLADPGSGRRAYEAGHIPGAAYAHLNNDLSGPITPNTGRHPLPSPLALAERLGSWGITSGVQVIAYDDRSGAMASRLWWLLRWLGHDSVAVLNGGFAAWQQAGLLVTKDEPIPNPAPFTAKPRPEMTASTDEVLKSLDTNTLLLVDARAPARFRGEVEPIDPVAGHIPGAINHSFDLNLGVEGRFRPAENLATQLKTSLGGRSPREVVAYCGSGVTACHNLLALEVAGLSGARLYPGSWSEWIRDPARPVETGSR